MGNIFCMLRSFNIAELQDLHDRFAYKFCKIIHYKTSSYNPDKKESSNHKKASIFRRALKKGEHIFYCYF